jgi:hypothetical protein
LVEEVGGIFVEDVDEDLGGEFDGGEADGALEGETGGDESSFSMVLGLTSGESLTISGSSWLLVSIFGRSNRAVLGFFMDEEASISEYLCAFVIS